MESKNERIKRMINFIRKMRIGLKKDFDKGNIDDGLKVLQQLLKDLKTEPKSKKKSK